MKNLRGAVADADAVQCCRRLSSNQSHRLFQSEHQYTQRGCNEGSHSHGFSFARKWQKNSKKWPNSYLLRWAWGCNPWRLLQYETTEVIIPQDYTPDSVYSIPDRTFVALLNRLCNVFGNNNIVRHYFTDWTLLSDYLLDCHFGLQFCTPGRGSKYLRSTESTCCCQPWSLWAWQG